MVGIGVTCSGDQLVMLGSEGRGDSDLPDPCSLQCGFQVLLPACLSAPPHSPNPALPTVCLSALGAGRITQYGWSVLGLGGEEPALQRCRGAQASDQQLCPGPSLG